MQMQSLTLPDDIVQIRLVGRLDLEGTEAITDPFTLATTARKGNIIVDLSALSFLASIGIRMLLAAAKAQLKRGGKLILAAPQEHVRDVLEASGIDRLVELTADMESAIARMKG